MRKSPLVSIVIVSLNRKNELLKCISSINSQTYKNYEIFLIDNNSNDNSCEIVKRTFPKTIIYKTKKNLGTSYTRNAGIKFSKGEIIWFLDSDSYLYDNDTLLNLINKFNSNIKIDAMGGEAMINDENKIIGTKKLVLRNNGMIKSYLSKTINDEQVKVLATCNLIVKRKVIEKVGGFDHFFFFYLEDLDLTYRIYKSGYQLYLMNDCSVVHYFSKKTRFQNYFLSNRNRVYFLIKNFNYIFVILLPIFDIMYILNLDTFKRIIKNFFNKSNSKYKVSKNEKKLSLKNIFLTIKHSFIVIISMLWSYIYIPYYSLLYFKNNKNSSNFINIINKKDFTLINNNINSNEIY